MSGKVSHGRGGESTNTNPPTTVCCVTNPFQGAANIKADDTPYTDGEIVREGNVGDQGDGPYSSGRGGAANIGGTGTHTILPADHDAVPEVATRIQKEESHHVGRGGAGNTKHVHHDKKSGDGKESLVEKVKETFHKK